MALDVHMVRAARIVSSNLVTLCVAQKWNRYAMLKSSVLARRSIVPRMVMEETELRVGMGSRFVNRDSVIR